MKVHIVLGTRPEIIKLSPVVHELQRRKIPFDLIHTGQHYSENMDKVFWDLFEMPNPKFHLGVREKTHARQTAEMVKQLDEIFFNEKPSWLLVQGDTNSTMCGALTASKHRGIRIAHIEAGLRSFDRTMPEEVNRVICDHISDLLLPPTAQAQNFLAKDGIVGSKVQMVGNTVEDSLLKYVQRARESRILSTHSLAKKSYILLTLHRQENTESLPRLFSILNTVFEQALKMNLKVAFPIHPRTKKTLEENGYNFPEHVLLFEPMGYLDFLALEEGAALAASDSGGVQEEACLLQVPCVTLRENTERPETLDLGCNFLAGVDPGRIVDCMERAFKLADRKWLSPYGGGTASSKIVEALLQFAA